MNIQWGMHLGVGPRAARLLALSASLAGLMPAAAMAQSASLPTREELGVGRAAGAAQAPSKLTVDGDIERGPCPLADPAYAAVKVNFGRVEFAGLSAVPSGSLDEAWQEFAGREVPLAALCEVRDRAATMLRGMGYLAAVQVPPQRIEAGGTVRMDVLVARLVDVQVRGDAGNAERRIAAHLAKLTAQPWFNVKQAERQLLLLRDLPGFDVRLTLRPAQGGAPGEVSGDVVVTRRPFEVIVAAQNLGSTTTGREGLFAQLTLNDLTGMGDRTSLSIYNTVQTGEQTVLQIAHDMELNSDGLRLGAKFAFGRSRPDVTGSPFLTHTYIGDLSLAYPLVRKEASTLVASGGLEAVDQSVDFGATRLSKDKLRVFYARLDLSQIDKLSLRGGRGFTPNEPQFRLGAGLELRQGVSWLGGSKDCAVIANCSPPNAPISNLLADPSSFVARAEATIEYRPVPRVAIVLTPRAQYSASQLLSYEQFSLGNYTIGRGFDPGIVQGDKGIGSGIELRLGKAVPRDADHWSFQPFAFLDTAWAWNNDGGITADPRHVWSAGGGLRARWGDHADFNLVVAVPLDKAGTQTARGDTRVLFTVTSRLLPWNP